MPTVHIRTLREAAEIVGPDNLAKHLGISAFRLEQWLLGHQPIPEAIFLQAVDIVVEAAHREITRWKKE